MRLTSWNGTSFFHLVFVIRWNLSCRCKNLYFLIRPRGGTITSLSMLPLDCVGKFVRWTENKLLGWVWATQLIYHPSHTRTFKSNLLCKLKLFSLFCFRYISSVLCFWRRKNVLKSVLFNRDVTRIRYKQQIKVKPPTCD